MQKSRKKSWRWILTQTSKSYLESADDPTQKHGHLHCHSSHKPEHGGVINDSRRCLLTDVATRNISMVSWTSAALPQWILRFPKDPGEITPAASYWLPRIVLISFFRAQRRKINGIQSDFSWFDEGRKLVRLAGPAAVSSHAALNSMPTGAMSSTYILS